MSNSGQCPAVDDAMISQAMIPLSKVRRWAIDYNAHPWTGIVECRLCGGYWFKTQPEDHLEGCPAAGYDTAGYDTAFKDKS